MKQIRSFKFFRMILLALSLTFLPLTTPIYAQSNDNNNRGADSRRDDDRDRRDRDDRNRDDDKDFPWGLLGLAGLLGLLGLRKPKREVYVDDRDYPPPPRDVPPRDVPPPRR